MVFAYSLFAPMNYRPNRINCALRETWYQDRVSETVIHLWTAFLQ